MANGYSAPNYGGYERQKTDVDYKYGNESVQNAYGRFISQQRGQRGLGDTRRNFQRQTPRFNAQWGRRGLGGGGVNSGVQQQAMNRYLGDYTRAYGRQQQDLTSELQKYDLNQQQLDAWRQQSYADIEAQKAREIAEAAQNLKYLQQIVGGLS